MFVPFRAVNTINCHMPKCYGSYHILHIRRINSASQCFEFDFHVMESLCKLGGVRCWLATMFAGLYSLWSGSVWWFISQTKNRNVDPYGKVLQLWHSYWFESVKLSSFSDFILLILELGQVILSHLLVLDFRSFYLGDAAGRMDDHSDADIKFAEVLYILNFFSD